MCVTANAPAGARAQRVMANARAETRAKRVLFADLGLGQTVWFRRWPSACDDIAEAELKRSACAAGVALAEDLDKRFYSSASHHRALAEPKHQAELLTRGPRCSRRSPDLEVVDDGGRAGEEGMLQALARRDRISAEDVGVGADRVKAFANVCFLA
jgi:hypothetical protein